VTSPASAPPTADPLLCWSRRPPMATPFLSRPRRRRRSARRPPAPRRLRTAPSRAPKAHYPCLASPPSCVPSLCNPAAGATANRRYVVRASPSSTNLVPSLGHRVIPPRYSRSCATPTSVVSTLTGSMASPPPYMSFTSPAALMTVCPPQRPAHPGHVRVLRSSLGPCSPGPRRAPPSGGPSRAWTVCLPTCCDRLPSGRARIISLPS
jgi:hypothetical protein